MPTNYSFRSGVGFSTWLGVCIDSDAEIWDFPADEAMNVLRQARDMVMWARDLEALYWFGCRHRQMDWRTARDLEREPEVLEATRRIGYNPLADPEDVEYAHALIQCQQQLQWLEIPIKAKRRDRRQKGFVYLLRGAQYYKIGCATVVDRRVTTISPQLPFEVRLVCVIPSDDMRRLESRLHQRFADKRAYGEWFILDADDIDYVENLAIQGDEDDS